MVRGGATFEVSRATSGVGGAGAGKTVQWGVVQWCLSEVLGELQTGKGDLCMQLQ